jgi:hypothetical protein
VEEAESRLPIVEMVDQAAAQAVVEQFQFPARPIDRSQDRQI